MDNPCLSPHTRLHFQKLSKNQIASSQNQFTSMTSSQPVHALRPVHMTWITSPEFPEIEITSNCSRARFVADKFEVLVTRTKRGPVTAIPARHSSTGRKRTAPLARIICWNAHGAPPSDKQLCLHWDDNPDHNQPHNLRWGSRADNAADYSRNAERRAAARENRMKGRWR